MIKELVLNDIGCADAFNVAFDYLAIVKQIQTWNISNKLNEIDRFERGGTVTDKEIANFHADVDPEQQVLRNEGVLPLGKNRKALVGSTRYEKSGLMYERIRVWKVQAKNKEGEWYTSDVIVIKSFMEENKKSLYSLSIRSNSRDIMAQVSKQEFPPRYGKPILFKFRRDSSVKKLEVDVPSIERQRWQLQDDLFDFGATITGSGKVDIKIPKGEDKIILYTLNMLRNIYGFDSKMSETESHYFIESSEYVFRKLGLTRFIYGTQTR
jgi:hypothetical protein